MSERELTPGNFFINMQPLPMDKEAVKKSRTNIYKMITKLTKELRQSKNLELRHTKQRKIDTLKLILEHYD